MQSITDIPNDVLARIDVVLSDIDDTLSTEGKLTAEAYEALWSLKAAGLKLIMVTGRPAGWCDLIARFWPVDAVVGENGGFYFHHDGQKLVRRFLYNEAERTEFRQRLEAIRERIMREVPGCGIASDQPYREYDLAIDFCEDVAPLPREVVLKIQSIFHDAGAHAKISSIHVNGWFGDFDKLTTASLCLKELFGIDFESQNERLAYCGDSPNDEPMFARFANSFGMANLEPFLDLIEHRPAWLMTRKAGAGFCELTERLLAACATNGAPR